MSNKPKILYRGRKLPNFITVKAIKQSVLPNFDIENNKIEFKEKEIEVVCAFNKRGQMSIQQQKELIDFLRPFENRLGKLYLYNDLNNHYMARIVSSMDIDGIKRAEFTIKFECDSYKISNKEFSINNSQINYEGQVPTYPTLEIKVTRACSEIEIAFKNNTYDNYIKIHGSFNSNDVIVLNQISNSITINGLLRMGIWDVRSKRHKLEQGLNQYTVKKGNIDFNIKYNEMNF